MTQNAPPDLSEAFFLAWVNMCSRLGVDTIDLIRVSFSESGGVRPSARNPNGDASGLIQFMPDTLRRLGWTKSTDEFRHLAAEDQVPFVERYYRPYAQWCTNDALCYVATFLPAMLPGAAGAGEGSDYVLCGQRGPWAWAYTANRGLDHDGDGAISVADMARQLELACVGARYAAIVDRLRRAKGEDPPPLPDPEPTQPEGIAFIPADPYDDPDDAA